jgi:hypothetical protein
MRWAHESAVTRRDEHLARTRKLSLWIAGGATAASLGLAAALGAALPGHTVSTASPSGPAATSGSSGSASGDKGAAPNTGTGNAGASGNTGSQHTHHHAAIAPPKHAPAHTHAPPVVSSGGS